MIFLVVFGHLIEIYKDHFYDLFLLIYLFHMPLFIFVGGYLAKRANMKKVINLALLYIIFQTIYNGFFSFILMKNQFDYTIPYFQLWYLPSMVIWYLIAMALMKVRNVNKYKLPILIVIMIISLLSRYTTETINDTFSNVFVGFNNYTLSYQRTLTLMIFFFLGFFMEKEVLNKIRTVVKKKALTLTGSILALWSYFYFSNKHNLELVFKGAFGVEEMTASVIPSFIQIVIYYGLSIYLCFLLLNIASPKQLFLKKWGDNSLQIFLFHAFAIKFFTFFPSILGGLSPALLLLALFIISTAIVFVLSSEFFIKYSNWLCRPYSTINNRLVRLKNAA